ncbi:gliding motility-associated-like protein [Dyadobacter jejuensis]|uniref:Gliding motility-associated-like protein n=1 Tax=Dyadobacter jejuensis TaxID=1082580 RepID=A0A316AQK6_9BACT|nr:gliding motility-associated C-terminal domain-containing protein [Dyadobacter jejuensis]PWJ60025.1 gliding motility-associated-like protein [Dyadobacter jejuensis]
MQKTLLVLLFSLGVLHHSHGQVGCENIGFELGTTSGWTLTYGTVTDANQKTVYSAEQSGSNDHYITNLTDGNDPKIPSIPMVAPGSTHSIRIGNITEGGHYSRLKTNFTVTADNTLLQYKFAVVLQNSGANGNGNAGHEPYQKPGFNIVIYNSQGQELACSNYDVQLQGNDTVDGFMASGDIQYRNWTYGAIDLRNYIGEQITMEVTAHGCTRQRHFGYAYFDAECLKSEIKQASLCPDEAGNVTLVAPAGFAKYTWSNGSTAQTSSVKASAGDLYSVKLLPLGSLNESCEFQLDYTIAYKKAESTLLKTICDGEEVTVGDTVYRTSGTFVRNVLKSSICDSTVTLVLTVNPVPKYTQHIAICEGDTLWVGDSTYYQTGTFINTIPRPNRCDSLVTTHLTVLKLDLTWTPRLSITQGDSTQIEILADPPNDNYLYRWNESMSLSCWDCDRPWAKPMMSEVFSVIVSDPEEVCARTAKITLTVIPCGVSIPDAFSPNNDQLNDVFYVLAGDCIKKITHLTIYNRWGQVIFYNHSFAPSDPNQGWTGLYDGLMSPPGIYTYKVEAEMKNGAILYYKGGLQLIR